MAGFRPVLDDAVKSLSFFPESVAPTALSPF